MLSLCIILTVACSSSKCESVMNLMKSSHPDDTDTTETSVLLKASRATFIFSGSETNHKDLLVTTKEIK